MMLNRIQSEQTDDGEIGNLEADQGGALTSRQKSRSKDSLPDYNRDASGIADPYDNVKSKASAFRRHQDRFSALVNSQYRVKKVGASKPVLSTYHDSFLYGKVPSSVKIRAALRSGWIGNIWHFLEFVLALTSGVLYVYSTYYEYTVYNWVSRAQNYISVAFLFDYVLRVYSESVRLYYIFSWWGLVDLLSALPIIFLFRYGPEYSPTHFHTWILAYQFCDPYKFLSELCFRIYNLPNFLVRSAYIVLCIVEFFLAL
jgi:hypothetical protein